MINEEYTLEDLEKNNEILDWNIYTKNRVFRFKGQGKAGGSRVIESPSTFADCFV
jgi:hypothetical protein